MTDYFILKAIPLDASIEPFYAMFTDTETTIDYYAEAPDIQGVCPGAVDIIQDLVADSEPVRLYLQKTGFPDLGNLSIPEDDERFKGRETEEYLAMFEELRSQEQEHVRNYLKGAYIIR